MKILHLTHWFPSQHNRQSGLFVKDYINAIHHQEPADAVILFLDICKGRHWFPRRSVLKDTTSMQIKIVHVTFSTAFWKFLYLYPQLQWLFLKRFLDRFVDDFRPEIVHAHVVHPSGGLAYKLCKTHRLPLIITEHWSNLEAYFRKPISSCWGRRAYHFAKVILPVSDFLKNNILRLLPALSKDKVVVVPDVVNDDVFYYNPRGVEVDNVLRFIAVSSWNRYKQISKRPDLIISGLALFSRLYHKEVHLTIVGDGNMLPEMKELADKEGISVSFAGRKSKPEIAQLLNRSDYFMHASNVETFSLVTAEALMTGTPVVVSDAGALPDLVSKERGVVCRNTIDDWAEGLHTLTTSTFHRQKMAEEFKSVCSFSVISSKVKKIYEDPQ